MSTASTVCPAPRHLYRRAKRHSQRNESKSRNGGRRRGPTDRVCHCATGSLARDEESKEHTILAGIDRELLAKCRHGFLDNKMECSGRSVRVASCALASYTRKLSARDEWRKHKVCSDVVRGPSDSHRAPKAAVATGARG